jgi:hypothetical protein
MSNPWPLSLCFWRLVQIQMQGILKSQDLVELIFRLISFATLNEEALTILEVIGRWIALVVYSEKKFILCLENILGFRAP